jgi:ADP-ribose pyrophosphatase
LYTAWDITSFNQQVDEDEFVINERLPFSQAVEMVHSCEISDAKTMVTILRAQHWWQNEGPFEI